MTQSTLEGRLEQTTIGKAKSEVIAKAWNDRQPEPGSAKGFQPEPRRRLSRLADRLRS